MPTALAMILPKIELLVKTPDDTVEAKCVPEADAAVTLVEAPVDTLVDACETLLDAGNTLLDPSEEALGVEPAMEPETVSSLESPLDALDDEESVAVSEFSPWGVKFSVVPLEYWYIPLL
ncbi:hypothetical protein LTR17_020168 [Elasticomyces elasticus]|nr:hypothetical protein LTR17_020168 [Elasticomyces elasticus]